MKSWILWGIGGLALIALAVIAGPSLLGPTPSTDPASTPSKSESSQRDTSPGDPSDDGRGAPSPGAENGTGETPPASQTANDDGPVASSIDIIVNGEPIATSQVDRAFRDLLERYQASYQQQGRNFSQSLQGPSGAYQELQIRYQAAQSVIDREIIAQQAEQRGIALDASTLQQAFEQRFRSFLNENSITEDQLVELYGEPQKRAATQRLLGIDDPSVEALKDRLRREVRASLLQQRLAEAVLGDEADLASEESQQAFTDWLQTRKSQSDIVYRDPLLNAHHLEQRISETEDLKERQARVQKTIGAYQAAKEQLDIDNTIDYILGLLYNIRVQISQGLKDQILEQSSSSSSEGAGEDSRVSQLDQEIEESRRQASQLLSPFNVDDEQQIRRMVQVDSGNPLYKYMYARFLFNNSDDPKRAKQVITMLNRALDLAPHYVDALTLYGDLRFEQGYFAQAVDYYRRALDAFDADIEPQLRTVARGTVRQRLAEAHTARARSIDPDSADEQTLTDRRRSLNQAEELLQDLQADLGPDDRMYATVLADLGDVAMVRGDPTAAQSHYQEALEVDRTAEVQVKLGHAYRARGDWTQAESAYRGALETSNGFAPAHEGLARLYRAQGQMDQAVREFRIAFGSGRLSYSERRQIALEALDLDPDNVDMRLSLGHFYLANNVYEGALEQYRAVLDASPQNVTARIGIGRVHLERLAYGDALSAFQNALDADPTPGERIEIYEWVIKAEQRRAGPGNPLPSSGREAIWQLAQLYAETDQPNESFERLLTLREDYPDFRPDDVRALMDQAKASVGDELPGQPTPNQGRQLIEPGEDHGPYATTPPTSGPHYVISADWGVHTDPIPDEVQVRNLAGGGVLVQYRPDLADETRAQLRELITGIRESGTHCRVLLAPYDGLSTAIALTAWTRIDTLGEFDAERIRAFISAHIEKGPEVGQVGCTQPGS